MRDFRDPLPFTPLHRHELRNALRLAVFRKEIDAGRRQAAFLDIESDHMQDLQMALTLEMRDPPACLRPRRRTSSCVTSPRRIPKLSRTLPPAPKRD